MTTIQQQIEYKKLAKAWRADTNKQGIPMPAQLITKASKGTVQQRANNRVRTKSVRHEGKITESRIALGYRQSWKIL